MPTQVPQTIPEALAVFKSLQADAAIDLSGHDDPTTLPGLSIRKNGAIGALPGVREELLRLIEKNAGAIFVTGNTNGVAEFTATAVEQADGNIVFVSAREVYRVLAKVTQLGIRGDNRFTPDTMSAFVHGLRQVMEELSIDNLPGPDFSKYMGRTVVTPAEVEALVEEVLRSTQVADELNVLFIQHRVGEEALKAEISTNFLPVIVTDATADEVGGELFQKLYAGKNTSVEVKGETCENNEVVIAFNKLKNIRKGIALEKARRVRKQKSDEAKAAVESSAEDESEQPE